ncbi:hypothetical protein GGTG_05139 [Gaeumannomyces tritici R3-111a-1]|uniref:Uncharacterized protein n=1 Tax=Gaeumannomyces tritici (strain R3-111a-1) TaxID=644352 RepID=J3NV30_GAET3|nr:hypothetical protein GGTG_05139 [Gaeumannomyces tritici R3-111a-1]EJT75202.1 hypothetical protein GGTG_05139 [Gaeumannomyces tritici R3-111a-1]
MAKLKDRVKLKLHEGAWSAEDLKDRPRVPEGARGRGRLEKEQFLLAIAPLQRMLSLKMQAIKPFTKHCNFVNKYFNHFTF